MLLISFRFAILSPSSTLWMVWDKDLGEFDALDESCHNVKTRHKINIRGMKREHRLLNHRTPSQSKSTHM